MEASALDGLLTEDLLLVQGSVRELAQTSAAPKAESWDHHGGFPAELWEELAGLGLFSLLVPDSEGGSGLGLLGAVVATGTLSEGAGLAGAMFLAQSAAIYALIRGEDAAARARNLPTLQSGEAKSAVAFAGPVPGISSVRAEVDGPRVRLFGEHAMVPFGGRAALHVARAVRGDEPVLASFESGGGGGRHSPIRPPQGLAGLGFASVQWDAAEGRLLGGAAHVVDLEDALRLLVAAFHVGVGRGAVSHAVRYVEERKQFGLELSRFGAMRERLAEADAGLEAARACLYLAAREKDRGAPSRAMIARARWLSARAGMAAADHAVQIYGGYGYSREYPVERAYREARFLGFGEGVASDLHLTISQGLRP